MLIVSVIFISGFASASFLSKKSCYASSQLNGSFPGSKACDNSNDDSTGAWIAAGSTNEWVILNLTTTYDIKNVTIRVGNYPFNGHIDVWTGSSWLAYKNFTEPATNSNTTYQLDHVFRGDRLRVFETTTSKTNVGIVELWPQGTIIPVCSLGNMGNTLDTLIPILVSAALIVFALGFFTLSHNSKAGGKKGFSMELLIISIIGLIIAIAVAAGTIASMKVC